jgi:glycosyltransferase involved in cell wall biosynthesis
MSGKIMKSKVSIITPTYNRAYCLPRLWKSISEQTYTSFSWVVVDDGSTDGTGSYIGSLDDERIVYYWQENKGYNNAKNQGAFGQPADYFVFLDSDESLFDTNTLANMVDDIENAPEDVAVVAYRAVDQNGKIRCNVVKNEIVADYHDLICGSVVSGEFIYIFKKNDFLKNPWPEVLGLDLHILWDIARSARKILYTEKLGRIYYIDDNQRHEKGSDNMSGIYNAIIRAPSVACGYDMMFRNHGKTMKAVCIKVYGLKKFYAGLYHAISGDRFRAVRNLKESWKNRGPKAKIVTLIFSLILPLFLLRNLFVFKTKLGIRLKEVRPQFD